jgi:hypothetical protein
MVSKVTDVFDSLRGDVLLKRRAEVLELLCS